MSKGAHIVVYVANRVPWPLDDGWKRRTFAVLQGLARAAEVRFVAPDPGADFDRSEFLAAAGQGVTLELSAVGRPRSVVATALRSAWSSESPLSVRHYTPELQDLVERTVEQSTCSLVVYAGSFLAERHARSRIASVPFVVDTHNIDSHAMARRAPSEGLLASMATRFVSRRLRVAESSVFMSARAVMVCSDDELPLVRERAQSARTFVVPNGVDTTMFRSAPLRARGPQLELLFFGNLDYPPNIDALQYFARSIHPLLKSREVRFTLNVVGAGQATRVRELLAGLTDVRLIGLSSDIVQTLHDSDAVIVPLRSGGGTRLKVLEALSSGRVVISTRLGAEGIRVVDREHLLFAETASAFVDAVETVISDPLLAAAVADNGSRLARADYSWEAIQLRLGDIIRELLQDTAHGSRK